MSDVSARREVRGGSAPPRPDTWAVGWMAFAAVLMSISGIWWIFSGLVALLDEGFYVVTEEWTYSLELTTWGWIHIAIGAALLAAGAGISRGAPWARRTGVVVAALATIVAFAWLPYYPLWAMLLIAISLVVIWALTAHTVDVRRA